MERHQSGSGFSKLRRSGCRQTTPNPKRSAYLQSSGVFTRQSDKSRDCPRYLVRHLSGSGGRIRLLTVLSAMLVVGALQLAIQPPSRRYIKRIEPLRLQSSAEVRCRQEVRRHRWSPMRQRHSTSYRKSASRSTAIDRSLPTRTGGLDFQSYRNKRKRRTRLNAPPSVFDTSVSRTAGLMVCGLDHWNPCSSNPTVPNRRKNLQGGCLSIRIIDFSRMTIYHLITPPRRPFEGVMPEEEHVSLSTACRISGLRQALSTTTSMSFRHRIPAALAFPTSRRTLWWESSNPLVKSGKMRAVSPPLGAARGLQSES